MSRFVHLHCHTEYSVLDGFGSVQAWCDALQANGMDTVAITEHGNVDSAIKMSQECRRRGIKLIAGVEMYVARDMRQKNPQADNRHICLYAQDRKGWANILKMLSLANVEGYHYKPRIDGQCLLEHLDGVVVGTACIASFAGTTWGLGLFRELAERIPDRLFCEVMPHAIDGQVAWNREVLRLARAYGLPAIATNDCHYPRREDAFYQDVCLCINSGTKYDDPRRLRFGADTFYCTTAREMLAMFNENHPWMGRDEVHECLANTRKLADMCEPLELDKVAVDLPLAPSVPEDVKSGGREAEDAYFKSLIDSGLKRKRGMLCRPLPEYRRRIREELAVLIPKGFTRYFLIVIDILKYCRDNGIAVGPGRGSVGGSLIAWLTGITQVDPLKYGLLFARFQDPERTDLPDIDCDFEMDRRDEVVNYIKASYGERNVAQITTFLTMKGRMALQDVARVFGIPREEVNAATKLLDDETILTQESFTESQEPELRGFYEKYRKYVDMALRLQGTVRGYGKHAAGVCISRHDLASGINGNLARRGGVLVSNWDKDEGEFMGLMKLDVLGLTALSRIRVCVEMVRENHGVGLDLEAIDLEDRKSLALIRKGDTVGVFQLGTRGLMQYCKDLGVSSFRDVYNATALFRPGTLHSGMAMEFVDRKRGKKWSYSHPCMEAFTKDTEGIIVYQEQFMMAFRDLAGFTWGECNKVRKVIAKSKGEEALNEYKARFLAGCRDRAGLDEGKASEIWATIVSFASYAFNLSHSVEYSVISMWDAWLKSHYRGEFYASSLSYLDEDKRIQMLSEAMQCGYRVALPSFGASHAKLWIYDPETHLLRMPFAEIIGVGEKQAELIHGLSKKKMQRTFFGYRVDFSQLPASLRKILGDLHAFDGNWSPTRRDLKNLKPFFKYDLAEILDL